MTNPHPISPWLSDWAALWGTPDLPASIQVEPGRRLRRSLGRCRPASGLVHIHPALFKPENADLFREVVCHEAAHVAAHLLHGRNIRPHGREWKELMTAAEYPTRARMDPRRLPQELQTVFQSPAPFRHLCRVCGAMWMARRRYTRWRCRTCYKAGLGGKLQIDEVAPVAAHVK